MKDKKNVNGHKTSATCSLASKDTPTAAFAKSMIRVDGKIDGALLCAIAYLDKESEYAKYTVTEPYKADVQVLSQ